MTVEKTFVIFAALLLASVPLTMLGMIPALASYALVAATVAAGFGIVVSTEESE